MTKKVTKNGMSKLQKAFLVGAVILGATGLYATTAKSADLLYAPKVPNHGFVDSQGWYIASHAGANFGDDFSGISFDTGYNLSGAVGYNWGEIGFASLRTEAEVGFLKSEASPVGPFTGSVAGLYGFLNAYADFNDIFGFTPFIGAGVGYADVNGEMQFAGFPIVDASDQTFAWNATAGLSYALSNCVSLDVAYRYVAIPDVTFNTVFGTVSDDVNIHQVNAGVRVKL